MSHLGSGEAAKKVEKRKRLVSHECAKARRVEFEPGVSPISQSHAPSWVTVTFDPITVLGTVPDGTLAVVVTYKTWRFKQYLPVGVTAPPQPEQFILRYIAGAVTRGPACVSTRDRDEFGRRS